MEDLVKSDVYYWAVVQEDLSGELEKGSVLATLGSSPVVPYANVTLENGQQVTVLLENPKGTSLGHEKPQKVIWWNNDVVSTMILLLPRHSIDCVDIMHIYMIHN